MIRDSNWTSNYPTISVDDNWKISALYSCTQNSPHQSTNTSTYTKTLENTPNKNFFQTIHTKFSNSLFTKRSFWLQVQQYCLYYLFVLSNSANNPKSSQINHTNTSNINTNVFSATDADKLWFSTYFLSVHLTYYMYQLRCIRNNSSYYCESSSSSFESTLDKQLSRCELTSIWVKLVFYCYYFNIELHLKSFTVNSSTRNTTTSDV